MKQKNQQKIRILLAREGHNRIVWLGKKIFWREDLVKKALNIVEDDGTAIPKRI